MFVFKYPGFLLSAFLLVVMYLMTARHRRFRVTVMDEYKALKALYEAALEKMREMRR